MTRRPNFLVVGAYKCGTTTLSRELAGHPDVYIPAAKEIAHLVDDTVLSEAGLRRYLGYFSGVRGERLVGECAPQYTARPRFTGAAERARVVLGPDIRVIYIVRDPIDRIVSHYRQMRADGVETEDIEAAIRHDSQLVAVSRFAWQIAPWLDGFGRDRVALVTLERLAKSRDDVLAGLCRFLGVDPDRLPNVPAVVANVAEDRRRKPAMLRRLLRSDAYRRGIAPRVPAGLRRATSRLLFPRAAPAEATLSPALEAALIEELSPEVREFERLFGIGKPLWPRWAPTPGSRRETAAAGDTRAS